MEEKERYELFGEHCVKDNDINTPCQLLDAYKACVILNEQDKRIKELENDIANYKYVLSRNSEVYKEIQQLKQENLSLQEQSIRDNQNWVEEAEQLKQSQKQLAIEELEKNEKVFILWFCSR